mmetsp:Transcript_8687/g.13374  ORF Transcript_8687/g.13374 Transcript_8687/m.13374 type:complete len:203 (-) Transcript_8687:150-758(-)
MNLLEIGRHARNIVLPPRFEPKQGLSVFVLKIHNGINQIFVIQQFCASLRLLLLVLQPLQLKIRFAETHLYSFLLLKHDYYQVVEDSEWRDVRHLFVVVFEYHVQPGPNLHVIITQLLLVLRYQHDQKFGAIHQILLTLYEKKLFASPQQAREIRLRLPRHLIILTIQYLRLILHYLRKIWLGYTQDIDPNSVTLYQLRALH